MKVYLVIPDLHCPFFDQDAVKLIAKIIKQIRLNGIVQLGDAIDAFQISTYSKSLERKNELLDDIEAWKKVLNSWASLLPSGADIHLLEGNHEFRLSRYIASNCREIHGLVPDWPQLLGLDLRNKIGHHRWHWHKYTKWDSCRIGDCVLTHGFYYNEHVALQSLKKYRCNIIFGHTHRFQFVSDGFHYAATLGHLSNEKETAHQPTPSGWSKYVGLLYVDRVGKTTFCPIKIDERKAFVNGQQITL